MAHIVTDATQSQLNATNVLYPNGVAVSYLQPAQAGADVTGYNTAKDTLNINGTPASTITANLAAAQAAATAAENQLATIGSNGWLSQGEKPAVALDWSNITGEEAGILASASSVGLSSTAYVATYTALSTYLTTAYPTGVGTGGSDWSNATTNSQVDPTTWSSKWNAYYNAKVALLNAIAAVNTSLATGANLVVNGNFESGPTGWGLGYGFGVGQYGVAVTGSWTAAFTGGTAACGNQIIGCYPGQVFTAQALIETNANGSPCVRVQFNNPTGANYFDGNRAGNWIGWNLSKVTCTAPAGATTVQFNMVVYNQTTGTTYFDCCSMSDATISASTGLNNLGSIAPGQTVGFNTVTTTASSITIGVYDQYLARLDGSSMHVNASSVTFSGLAASTYYFFFPYIQISTGNLMFANPTPPQTGTTNNPGYALTMCSDGNYPASPTFLYISTGSASNPGGGGKTVGGPQCPEGQELVSEQIKGEIKAIDVLPGDYLKGKCFATGEDVYRRVLQTRRVDAGIWYTVDGHKVSPCESIWSEGEFKPAYKATGAVIDRSLGTRVDISLDADDYQEQNYYLVSGTPLLIHNMNVNPC